jgi:hypothetical protein
VKKIFVILLVAGLSSAVFAQELKLSGEVKTGIYWEQSQLQGNEPEVRVKIHSKDDAGSNQGRFRLNLEYDNGKNFGMKARLNWQAWKGDNPWPEWPYAFGYGNFFNDQLTVSVGILGASPWGTGGPEMWKELEEQGGGMRVEWKPNFIPEKFGKLNLGFVLNDYNKAKDQGIADFDAAITILEILKESVLGVSYTHDYFHVRLAYRLDSGLDYWVGTGDYDAKGEDELIYRIEERVLNKYVPGLQVWALGYFLGMGAKHDDITLYQNWLFVQYAPEMFTAQIRFGLDVIPSRTVFHLRPSFYWNFFDKLLSVGASFWYGQDFGSKIYEGSPYQYIEIEPKIQINFSSSYIAFAYNFRKSYKGVLYDPTYLRWTGPVEQRHWMNLRFCIYY